MSAVPAGGRVAVIGDGLAVEGYAQAGALVLPAAGAEEARACWSRLGPDVAVVVLTAAAAQALGDLTASGPLTVVLPT